PWRGRRTSPPRSLRRSAACGAALPRESGPCRRARRPWAAYRWALLFSGRRRPAKGARSGCCTSTCHPRIGGFENAGYRILRSVHCFPPCDFRLLEIANEAVPLPTLPPRALASGGEGGRRRPPGGGFFVCRTAPPTPPRRSPGV